MPDSPGSFPFEDPDGVTDADIEDLLADFQALPVKLAQTITTLRPISAAQIAREVQFAVPACAGRANGNRHKRILNLASEAITFFYDAMERRALPPTTIFTLMGEVGHQQALQGGSSRTISSAIEIANDSAWDQLRETAMTAGIANTDLDQVVKVLFKFTALLSHAAHTTRKTADQSLADGPGRSDLAIALGKSVRAIRLSRSMSQEAFADSLGYRRSYFGSLERGERNISLRALERLADAIGVDPITLLRP